MPDNPTYVTCHCQHCDGHIEFDASDLAAGETRTVECPHCGKETDLCGQTAAAAVALPPIISPSIPPIPPVSIPPPPLIPATRKRWFRIISLAVVLATLAAFVSLIVKSIINGNFKGSGDEGSKNGGWSTSTTITNGSVVITRGDWRSGGLVTGVLFLDNGEGLGVTPLQGNYLKISVWISNTDPKMKMDFSTWRDDASLSDDCGNVYKRITSGFGQRFYMVPEDTTSIYPGSEFRDMLIFEPPVSAAKKLYLELPASNFGGWGAVRFEIPMISDQAPSPAAPVKYKYP